jgi:hypothetical protein
MFDFKPIGARVPLAAEFERVADFDFYYFCHGLTWDWMTGGEASTLRVSAKGAWSRRQSGQPRSRLPHAQQACRLLSLLGV